MLPQAEFQPVKKILGIVKGRSPYPVYSGCAGSSGGTDRPERAVSLCSLPPASPKDERQRTVNPSKNWFFDGLKLRRRQDAAAGGVLFYSQIDIAANYQS